MNSGKLKTVCVVLASAGIALVPMGCKQTPVTLSAAANPPAVYQGQPVTVTATPGTPITKKSIKPVYTWSGENVTGNGSTATVNTASENPGSYTVTAKMTEIHHCGFLCTIHDRPIGSAEATANYEVKSFEPPTVGCSASPSTIKPGETSVITATGVSPQNRPLTYSYSAAAGSISSHGETAEFNSAGAPTGTVAITCTVTDDKNQTASSETNVTITAPYIPPAPHAEALCSVSFAKDKMRPDRVDNEGKACLDEVALDLEKQPDAKLVIVGNEDAKEQARIAREEKLAKRHHHVRVQDDAAQRAVNTKEYLVTEKGIDASRISVVTGMKDAQEVDNYLVPSGANFSSDVTGTTPVDESMVKAQPRTPLALRHAYKKAAAASKKAAAASKKAAAASKKAVTQ
ncbi:MAG: hypothetical protein ACP5FH_09115 [Terracidiphilus sp.]